MSTQRSAGKEAFSISPEEPATSTQSVWARWSRRRQARAVALAPSACRRAQTHAIVQSRRGILSGRRGEIGIWTRVAVADRDPQLSPAWPPFIHPAGAGDHSAPPPRFPLALALYPHVVLSLQNTSLTRGPRGRDPTHASCASLPWAVGERNEPCGRQGEREEVDERSRIS